MKDNIDKGTKVSPYLGCDAVNCIHNGQQGQCYAESVKVGTEHATNCSDTVCRTFIKK